MLELLRDCGYFSHAVNVHNFHLNRMISVTKTAQLKLFLTLSFVPCITNQLKITLRKGKKVKDVSSPLVFLLKTNTKTKLRKTNFNINLTNVY